MRSHSYRVMVVMVGVLLTSTVVGRVAAQQEVAERGSVELEKKAKSWLIERAKLPKFDPPRTPDGHPDMQGLWNGGGSGDDIEEHPYIDLTTPPQESFISDPPDGKIPYQPWALAERNKHRRGLGRGWPGESGERLYMDPQSFCILSVPRSSYRGGFQIVQTRDYFLQIVESGHFYRAIPTDGRPHDIAKNVKLMMGQSRGRWEGNTLVVDVTNQTDEDWFDSVGNFYSDAVHFVERWTLVAPNIIDYQIIVEDPTVYTRPWTMSLPLERARQPYELWEHACHEGNRDDNGLLRGKELGFKVYPGVVRPK